ncbi:MAG: SufD family Fe-S cluster assembly protein [Verrucomicrobiota bacterium]
MSAVLEQERVVSFPVWYELRREEARAEFEKLAWPTRKDENWRFGRIKEADLSGAQVVHGGVVGQLPEPAIEGALRFVFWNNELVATEGEVPAGVIAGPLADVLRDHGDALEAVMPPLQGKLGSGKLAAMHRAQSEGGMALVLEGHLDRPVEIVHVVSGEGATVLPYLFLVAKRGAKGSVVERFVNASEGEEVTVVSVSDVVMGEETQVKYLVSQELNAGSRMIRLADSKLGRHAAGKVGTLQTGARWSREEVYSTVEGAEGNSEILSVAIPDTGQEYDQRTFQHHGAPHTGSDLLFKNTLFGKGKTIFSGLIFVDEGAHYTDAYQTCRNLLMSDEAEATSMPGLEINADQVKCSHGSTSARVSDEEIYYLCSRGIDPVMARRMIAQGFSAEVVEKLEDERLEEFALGQIAGKFSRVS